MSVLNQGRFFCVEIDSKNVVFDVAAGQSAQSHWLTIDKEKYLSLQTTWNTINFFKTDIKSHSFKEDERFTICTGKGDKIHYSDVSSIINHLVESTI